MKTITKRLIAILCCVAMLVTGLYVSEPRKAEAASSGTMAFTYKETGYKLYDGGDTGYINVGFSISTSIPLNPGNYNAFTDDFIDNYMIFEGGMTKEDFKNGFETAKFATESIMQIRWPGRTEAFEAGWSFTIVQGAEIPYNDGAAYVTLDKEYTFVFTGGNETWTNVVNIAGYNVTTYSLPIDELIFNGKSGGEYNLWFTFNTPNIPFAGGSVMLTSDETYADYIAVEGIPFSELENQGVQFKVYFGANGQRSAFQILSWGSIRTKMLKGDQIIFKKGMPLYFTDANGDKWKGVLDETHVYECMYDYTVQNDHDQVFDGVKVDSTNVFSMDTHTKTVPIGGECNYSFTWSAGDSQSTAEVENNILANNYVTQDYLEFLGCTREEITENNSMKIFFIPHARVIQIEIYDASTLDVGDQIIMKKGMPIVWNKGTNEHKALCAVLDDDYAFTVKSKSDSSVEIAVTQMGNLSITNMGYNTENHGDVLYRYDQAFCTYEDAETAEANLEQSVLKDYVYLSEHSYDDLINAGAYLRYYTAHDMFRLYYQDDKMSLKEGEILIWRKGFPITYTTTSGKAKTVTLDKDYGFRYSASTGFTYDPSLVYEEEPQQETFQFTSNGAPSFPEGGYYKNNLVYATNMETPTDSGDVANILESTGVAGNTSDYVDIFGMTSSEVSTLGISIKMYPTAGTGTFQIFWKADVFDWIEDGLILTFKKGMPVYYATGDVMYLTEDTYYQVTNVTQPTSSEATDGAFTLQSYEPPLEVKKFTLSNIFGTGPNFTEIASTKETGIELFDAEGNEGLLNDADNNEIYQWIGGGEVSYEEAARWVDYLGLSADQLEACGVKFRLVRNGDTQVINITWGTSVDRIALGSQITFKAGMPFSYTVGGKEQKIELAQDYTFEVTGSNTDNTWVFEALTTENSGTYSLKYGMTSNVATQTVGDETQYYNNIDLIDSQLLTDCNQKTQYVPLADGVLMKYLEFGSIAPKQYQTLGISAKMIIDVDNGNDAKTLQLVWGVGSLSSSIRDGDTVVFKAGMPITMTANDGTTKRYTLDRNYTYKIEEYSGAEGGYRLSGIVEEEINTTQGDVDGDYLLDKNDITLLRKQLIGLIAVSDEHYANANGTDEINSADLVRAKTTWGDEEEQETYTTLYEDIVIPSGNLAGGATTTITINKDLGTAGYLRFTYQSTADLYGTIYYTYNGKEYSENFYLSKDDVQFEQFLDNYRVNGVLGTSTPVNKTLTEITFKNLSDEAATFLLNKLEVSDREFKNNDMLKTDNGKVKIGVDLNQGGTLTWLQDLVHNPVEYTSNNILKIATKAKYTSGSNAITDVNLVNIYDLGRQMQQSYYIDVLDTEDGHGTSYVRGSYNDNTNWPYNPVQAGDQFEHQSQIIDYRVIDGKMIYVKVRAMDWADPDKIAGNSASAEGKSEKGTTTKSYMESWYRLEDDMLFVDNAFVDWSGWTTVTEAHNQELPAFYTAAALNWFVAGNDTGTRTIYGNWDVGTHFRVESSEVSNWYAYINENSDTGYGLGIYIPNATGCTAGRYRYTSKYSRIADSATDERTNATSTSNGGAGNAPIFDVGAGNGSTIGSYLSAKSSYQNCYLANTSYIAPTIATILKEYRTYSYTYVLHANELNEMKSAFSELEEEGTVTNQQLSIW